jgi:hypothetical protein
MKKQKHFRAIVALFLVFGIIFLIWDRAELSALQIGSIAALLLTVAAGMINNHRNETIHFVSGICGTAAVMVYFWSDVHTLPGALVTLALSILFIWGTLKPDHGRSKDPGNSGTASHPRTGT